MKQNPSSMRAAEILRNKFGVSQLYSYDVTQDGEVLFKVFWHPLTIAERESIQKKVGSDDANDFALGLMIEKAWTGWQTPVPGWRKGNPKNLDVILRRFSSNADFWL